LIHGFVWAMPSRRINNFPESRRGLGHVTLQFLALRSAILATAWLLVSLRFPFSWIGLCSVLRPRQHSIGYMVSY